MKITVSRQPANRPGPDIIDPLLTSEIAAISRGQNEIDYNVSKRSIEHGNCILLPYMETGKLVNVTKSRDSYRGQLTMWATVLDISEDGSEFSATTSITIEREIK